MISLQRTCPTCGKEMPVIKQGYWSTHNRHKWRSKKIYYCTPECLAKDVLPSWTGKEDPEWFK